MVRQAALVAAKSSSTLVPVRAGGEGLQPVRFLQGAAQIAVLRNSDTSLEGLPA